MSVLEPLPSKLQDFRGFLHYTWSFLRLPKPTPIQLDIAHWLQHGPRRKIIQAFRGVGKSWITSTYVVWRLRMNPDYKFLVVSASKARADNFTTFTLNLIKGMDVLRPLMPRRDQRESVIAFDVGPARPDHSPSVMSVGIYGQLTGSRADEIIPDDVEVANNSMTQIMRDKLAEAVKEFDAVVKPGGRISFLGTPQCEMTLYNTLAERGYEIRVWPARYPALEEASSTPRLAPTIVDPLVRKPDLAGRATDPDRFSEMDLMEREASYGRSGFALQFMLDTRLSDRDRYPLKLGDLIVMDLHPDIGPEKVVWSSDPRHIIDNLPCVGLAGDRYHRPMWVSTELLPYNGIVMAIDPSGRGKDETAYAVVAMLNGYLFVLDCGGLEGGYSDATLTRLAVIAQRFKVKAVVVESNFGDGMFSQLLKPHLARLHPVSIEEVRHNIQKEKRILDTLEPVISQHRMVMDKGIIERDYSSTSHLPPEQALKYQLFYQMSRLTRDRGSLSQDDRIDVLSIAVNYWVEALAQDADVKVQSRIDRKLQQELDTFLKEPWESDDRLLLLNEVEAGRLIKAEQLRRETTRPRGRIYRPRSRMVKVV